MIRVDHAHVMGQIKVGGGDDAFAVLAEHDGDFVAAFKLEDNALEVEQDVDDVFENTVDLGVFVNHARDLGFRRREADHGAQKNAAKSIAERVTVAAFERFERNDGTVGIVFCNLNFNGSRLEKSGIGHE